MAVNDPRDAGRWCDCQQFTLSPVFEQQLRHDPLTTIGRPVRANEPACEAVPSPRVLGVYDAISHARDRIEQLEIEMGVLTERLLPVLRSSVDVEAGGSRECKDRCGLEAEIRVLGDRVNTVLQIVRNTTASLEI